MLRLLKALACLAPLAMIAAAPAQEPPDRTPPGPDQLQQPLVVGVYDWLTILPAPQTPDGFAPGAGAREQWPLHGPITQPYGCTGFELERPAQDCPTGFHTGIDLGLPEGTPIHAAGPGLAYPFLDSERYGNHVLIQEEGGVSTVYGHMVRTNVSWGQRVRAGDVIGFVGSTGNSTGPHLHFEVRFAGVPYDPMPYLSGSPADPAPLPAGWPGAPPDDWRGLR